MGAGEEGPQVRPTGGGTGRSEEREPFLDTLLDTKERTDWLLATWACNQEPALGTSNR